MRGSLALGTALLGLCLLASRASGQAQQQEPSAIPSLLPDICYKAGQPGDVPCKPDSLELARHPRVIAELRPDSTVRVLWDKVVSCAGPARDTTKKFERIHFYERDSVFINGLALKGEYVPPDTIYLTTGLEREGWVVAHELLHYALNSSSYGPKAHDPIGAFISCGLMEFQHPKPRVEQSFSNGPGAAPRRRYLRSDPLTNGLLYNTGSNE